MSLAFEGAETLLPAHCTGGPEERQAPGDRTGAVSESSAEGQAVCGLGLCSTHGIVVLALACPWNPHLFWSVGKAAWKSVVGTVVATGDPRSLCLFLGDCDT